MKHEEKISYVYLDFKKKERMWQKQWRDNDLEFSRKTCQQEKKIWKLFLLKQNKTSK